MHVRPRYLVIVISALAVFLSALFLYRYNVIPHKSYTGEHFGLTTYTSSHDEDGDGIDDQTDILQGALAYTATKPAYKSKYYDTGYPDDGYGVCTDVVAQAMLAAGYDLMELVHADILASPGDYGITAPDKNIDFRRVRNLQVYFGHTAISLTRDIQDISQWQGGDIVVFEGHIGILSDKRNSHGIPFVIHHGNPYQLRYEEDILQTWGEILGHYRIS